MSYIKKHISNGFRIVIFFISYYLLLTYFSTFVIIYSNLYNICNALGYLFMKYSELWDNGIRVEIVSVHCLRFWLAKLPKGAYSN